MADTAGQSKWLLWPTPTPQAQSALAEAAPGVPPKYVAGAVAVLFVAMSIVLGGLRSAALLGAGGAAFAVGGEKSYISYYKCIHL